MTVMGIYHKQFTEVIQARYISDEKVRLELFTILAQFFGGTYAKQPKEITLKLKQWNNKPSRKLMRNVREQPLVLAKGRLVA